MKKTVVLLGLALFLVIFLRELRAGSLTPGANPAATSYTLSDVYARLTTNAPATVGNHPFSPAAAPGGTLKTLTEIYNAIPTIDVSKVGSGTTYFGVSGTYNMANLSAATVKKGVAFGVGLTGDYPSIVNPLPGDTAGEDAIASFICSQNEVWQKDGTKLTGSLSINPSSILSDTAYCGVTGSASSGYQYGDSNADFVLVGATGRGDVLRDQFNGTGAGITGGAQANGGVDDFNNLGAPPSDRYPNNVITSQWTICASGNNYCSTGLSSAAAKDNSTGLIWSQRCLGTGCTSFSNTWPYTTYSWTSGGSSNGGKTAKQLCSSGNHGQSGWSLPHRKQLLQAYVDGSYGNIEAERDSLVYWSATHHYLDQFYKWGVNLSEGFSYTYNSGTSAHVRCVR